jgi:hypothetical protein
MEDVYRSAIINMAQTLKALERAVPPPQVMQFHGRAAYRYKEQSVHQAIVMKLVRLTSALQAAQLLLQAGLLQDFGACQRVIDEINEDVAFLCLSVVRNDETQWHARFLAEFWQEEFDGPTAMTSTQKRARVPREKVRGYLAQGEEGGIDQSARIKINEGIAKAYSGFVHGAGSHIMQMYYGNPPCFHPVGELDSPYLPGHAEDLQNYFLRAICSFGFAAAAFGSKELKDTIIEFRAEFERRCGMTFDPKETAAILRRQRKGTRTAD